MEIVKRPDYSTPPPRWRWLGWWALNVFDLFVGSPAWKSEQPIRRARDYGFIGRNELRWRLIRGDTRGLPERCFGWGRSR